MIHHRRSQNIDFESFNFINEFSKIVSAQEIHARFWQAESVTMERDDECTRIYPIPPNSNYGRGLNTNSNTYNCAYKRSPLSHEHHMAVKTRRSSVETEEMELNYEPLKYRRYKRNNEVAHHCQRLLKTTAYPTVAQLTILIHQISQSNRQKIADQSPSELDSIRSTVLQWFRKRREYLAAKVYNACDERMGEAWMSTCLKASNNCERGRELSYEEIVEEIVSDDEIMREIFLIARLPVTDELNGLSFVRRKVKDYFMKLCSKS